MSNPPDNGLALFNSLLAKARADLGAAQDKKVARKQRPSYLATAAEEHEREYREVYYPELYLARYWRQVCRRCTATLTGLEGVYEQRKHPRSSARIARRLASIENLDSLLPRQQQVNIEYVAACLQCVDSLDFEVQLLPELFHAKTTQPEPSYPRPCELEAGDDGEVPDLDS
jgi:hypothetical protein